MENNVRLACLDMAGTVVNDNGIVIDAFTRALVAVGVPEAEMGSALRYAHDTMGLPKFAVFRHLLVSDERVEEALGAFAAAIDDAIAGGRVTEIPGARQAMTDLRAAGVTVCLTTGFSPEVQEAIIKHLDWGGAADFFIAPGEGLRGRPYPDMVLSAVLRAGVDDVRQVAVAGDTANDLWSGWRAGASVVAGVLTGSHGREELEQAPHTHILASVLDLPALLA